MRSTGAVVMGRHAYDMAKASAGERDVTIVGGAKSAQQCINAALFDEIQVGVVPTALLQSKVIIRRRLYGLLSGTGKTC